MEGSEQIKSAGAAASADHALRPELELHVQKVDRAAADLYADFQRQHGVLNQAQFDRLVLRRNLSPPEMVALIGKLSSLGVELHESLARPSNGHVTGTPAATERLESASGQNAVSVPAPNPNALLSSREEIELGRRLQLAL